MLGPVARLACTCAQLVRLQFARRGRGVPPRTRGAGCVRAVPCGAGGLGSEQDKGGSRPEIGPSSPTEARPSPLSRPDSLPLSLPPTLPPSVSPSLFHECKNSASAVPRTHLDRAASSRQATISVSLSPSPPLSLSPRSQVLLDLQGLRAVFLPDRQVPPSSLSLSPGPQGALARHEATRTRSPCPAPCLRSSSRIPCTARRALLPCTLSPSSTSPRALTRATMTRLQGLSRAQLARAARAVPLTPQVLIPSTQNPCPVHQARYTMPGTPGPVHQARYTRPGTPGPVHQARHTGRAAVARLRSYTPPPLPAASPPPYPLRAAPLPALCAGWRVPRTSATLCRATSPPRPGPAADGH